VHEKARGRLKCVAPEMIKLKPPSLDHHPRLFERSDVGAVQRNEVDIAVEYYDVSSRYASFD
jgi:hypothetical protein